MKPIRLVVWVLGAALVLWGATEGRTDAPKAINYQGRILDDTNLYSGPLQLEFRLFNAPTGGTLLHLSTNFATAVDGLYATRLGEFVTFGNVDDALTNAQVWLEVVANGATFSPRERLLAVPYARTAYQLDALRVTTNNALAPNLIGGSALNSVGSSAVGATIGGGGALAYFGLPYTNSVDADFGTVAGGAQNVILQNSSSAAIAGGLNNTIWPGAICGLIGGGFGNSIGTNAIYATIAGGRQNQIQRDALYAFISGGRGNSAGSNARYAAIGGGIFNSVADEAWYSSIAGGQLNSITGPVDAVSIAGGQQNTIYASADYATIGGGRQNSVRNSGAYATIPGGYLNAATNYAFAAGRRAIADHTGAFVWGDSTDANVASAASNQVTFRAGGGFRIFTSAALTSGVQVAANSGAWTTISDVNAKEDFAPVNPQEILEKVAQLPIATWRYKGQDAGIRHIGPTAQDFAEAFSLGDAPGVGITTVDADGVLFAAVQALARENEALKAELAAIKQKLGL